MTKNKLIWRKTIRNLDEMINYCLENDFLAEEQDIDEIVKKLNKVMNYLYKKYYFGVKNGK